jgi:hypothetical protein
MSRAAVPLLGYAVLIGIAAAGAAVWSPDPLPAVLLGGGAAVIALIAAVVGLRGPDDATPGPPILADPDLSLSVVAIAFGLCTLLVGAYLGLYLILIGGAVLLAGLGGLVRELRAERRALRRARDGGGDAG